MSHIACGCGTRLLPARPDTLRRLDLGLVPCLPLLLPRPGALWLLPPVAPPLGDRAWPTSAGTLAMRQKRGRKHLLNTHN